MPLLPDGRAAIARAFSRGSSKGSTGYTDAIAYGELAAASYLRAHLPSLMPPNCRGGREEESSCGMQPSLLSSTPTSSLVSMPTAFSH